MRPILEPMAVRCEPALLDLDSQRLLAVWAVKTVYLLELASRQRYPGARLLEGYHPSTPEIGWLLAQLERRPARLIEPPPRSMVWLACWDCKTPNAVNRASTVNYAPSTAPLPTPDGGEVIGQFTTLAVGFAAFQVFTADVRMRCLLSSASDGVDTTMAPGAAVRAGVLSCRCDSSGAAWPSRAPAELPVSAQFLTTSIWRLAWR